MTTREKIAKVCDLLAKIAADNESFQLALEKERDSALSDAESKPCTLMDGETPLTHDSLVELGFAWDETRATYKTGFGRLTMWVRLNGQWGLAFSASYGGQVGMYRRIRSIEDVRLAMYLFGIGSKGGA